MRGPNQIKKGKAFLWETLFFSFFLYGLLIYALNYRNDLVFLLSLLFLTINSFSIVPIFESKFNGPKIRRMVKKNLSASISILRVTKVAQLLSLGILIVSVMTLIVLLAVSAVNYALERPVEIYSLFRIFALLWGSVALYMHPTFVGALMGYSGSVPSNVRPFLKSFLPPKRALSEGLDEAKVYLLLSSEYIKKNLEDGIISFEYSLISIDKTLRKETKFVIANLETALHTLDTINEIDPFLTHETRSLNRRILTKYIDRIKSAIDSKRINELNLTLSDFINVNRKELRYAGVLKRKSTKVSKNMALVAILMVPILVSLFNEEIRQIFIKQWQLFLVTSLVGLVMFAVLLPIAIVVRFGLPDALYILLRRKKYKKDARRTGK